MKRIAFNLSIMFLAASLTFTACKKKDKEVEPTSNSESTQSSDESGAQSEMDQAMDDVSTAIGQSSGSMGGRVAVFNICGLSSVDSVTTAPKSYTLNFDGTTACVNGTRKRSGSIVITLTTGTKWRDAGSIYTVQFNNYTVTRISDGKLVKLVGNKSVTNVSGGLLRDFNASPARTADLVFEVNSSNMSVTFDNGTTRTWNVARRLTYSNPATGLQLKIEGTGAADGKTQLVTWGTNRYGNMFYTKITSPLIVRSDCGWFKPVSGTKLHDGVFRDLTVIYGVDASGNAVTTGCPGYYKATWVNTTNNNTASAIIAY